MSFRDYAYPEVLEQLGLTDEYPPLFPDLRPISTGPDLSDRLEFAVNRYAATGIEKARSDFLVAPVLLELGRRYEQKIWVFAGEELPTAPNEVSGGPCDFVLTTGRLPYEVAPPIVAVVKTNPVYTTTGFGPCIAAMLAAQHANERDGRPLPAVYGVSTTGVQWTILRLAGTAVAIDPSCYLINQPEWILGVLSHIIELATAENGSR